MLQLRHLKALVLNMTHDQPAMHLANGLLDINSHSKGIAGNKTSYEPIFNPCLGVLPYFITESLYL
jgi:hypothetical protein